MKAIITIILITISFFTIYSQDNGTGFIDIGEDYKISNIEEHQYEEDNKRHHGWLIGVSGQYGELEKQNAIFAEAQLSYIMDRTLEVGLSGTTFYTEQDNDLFESGDVDIFGGYAGLHISPILFPSKSIHISFPIMLGVGAVGYDDLFRDVENEWIYEDDWDEIFVAEAGISILFNVSSFLQIEITRRYRKSTDIELNKINDFNLNGKSCGFGIRLGSF